MLAAGPVRSTVGAATGWGPESIDATHRYSMELSSEGIVLLGPEEEPKKVNFTVTAVQSFDERAVIADGSRFASRVYDKAEMVKKFGAQDPERVSIGDDPLAVIASSEEPDSGRMLFRAAERPMTQEIRNLLQVPFSPMWLDELAALLFQRGAKLKVGDRVDVPNDLIAKLFCLDVVTEHQSVCEVEKANDTQAVLKLAGELTGRSLDAVTKIRFNASTRALFETRTLSQLRASFVERREPGVIAPGYTVSSKLKLDQATSELDISTDTIRRQLTLISREPIFQHVSAKNRIELQHTPQWHLVLDQKGAQIWRLIVDGQPMTQCNVLLPATTIQEPLPLKDFVREVEQTLGGNLRSILRQETLKGLNGTEILRVIATGTEEEVDLTWNYYHMAAVNGRRAQLVFTTESSLIDVLGQSDSLMAQSLNLTDSPIAMAN